MSVDRLRPRPSGPLRRRMARPTRRQRRRVWLVIAVVGVVVLLVLGVAAFIFIPNTSPSANVTVTSIAFTSTDDACGVVGATSHGFNAESRRVAQDRRLHVREQYRGPEPLRARSRPSRPPRPGSVSREPNVPLVIPANEHATLSFTVNMPGSAYTGTLTLVVT